MEKPYKHGLFPGSFDPITEGHIDIIERACQLCEKVTVGLFVNPDKSYLFSTEERIEKIKAAIAHLPMVDVCHSDGMTCKVALEMGCDVLIRGFRNPADYAYEAEMAHFNFTHAHLPTYILDATPTLRNVSSTAVREALKAKGDLS